MLRPRWTRADSPRYRGRRPRLPLFQPSRSRSPRRACRRPRSSSRSRRIWSRRRQGNRRRRKTNRIQEVEVRMEGIAEAPARKPAGQGLAGLRIGEILLAQGAVTREKLEEALAAQGERGGRL